MTRNHGSQERAVRMFILEGTNPPKTFISSIWLSQVTTVQLLQASHFVAHYYSSIAN